MYRLNGMLFENLRRSLKMLGLEKFMVMKITENPSDCSLRRNSINGHSIFNGLRGQD